MVQATDMAAIQMLGNGYTSCIKINGVAILPPLITSERRLELENYKKKAIDIEKRLKCQKDLKLFVERLESNHSKITNTEKGKTNNPHARNRTLENILSFGGDESYLDALNIPDISRESDKLPSKDCRTLVPSREHKFVNLTCNIFDVTEYSDNGVVIFKEYKSDPLQIDKQLSASTVELDLTDLSCAEGDNASQAPKKSNSSTQSNSILNLSKSFSEEDKSITDADTILNKICEQSKPKSRLLRSNSYTLESPSPLLIEHFKKQAEQDLNGSYTFENYSGPKRRSLDLGRSGHCSISCDNFGCETNGKTVKNPPENRNTPISDDTHNKNEQNNTSKGCDFISVENMKQAVQDLAQKHLGTKTCPSAKVEIQEVSSSVVAIVDIKEGHDSISLNSRVEEAEAALQEVLNDMPESYAKEIMELLGRHKKEQEMKLKSYAAFKQKLFDQNVNLNGFSKSDTSKNLPPQKDIVDEAQLFQFDPLSPHNYPAEKQLSETTFHNEEVKSFACDSQMTTGCTLSSPTDTLTVLNTSTPLLIDFESDSYDNEPLVQFERSTNYSNSDPLNVLRSYDDYRRLAANKSPNCSRELFPEKPDKMQRKLREQWAATVLTAAAKGFLVRRLKRTERVKNLIQTIQDALLCAMSLHTETTENIKPPDVELHRRLIQQVSAACYEFYDIFFNLTTKEQMALIALDRQRLQEKLKRPKSTSSLKLDSGKSTPKSQRHSFTNVRQRKVLTPSFAA